MPQIACPKCGTAWPSTFQFCGRCGQNLQVAAAAAAPANSGPPGIPPPPPGPAPLVDATPMPIATSPPAPVAVSRMSVRLVVLRGAVTEGTGYELRAGRSTIGRVGELAFPGDSLLSPKHVVLERLGDGVDVVEVPGQSGCFRRIREPTAVRAGDVVFAGEQYLLVRNGDAVPCEAVDGDDLPPEIFGTPLPAPRLHVTQLLAGGLPGRVVSTDRDVVTVGREGCDLSFPQDRFMSGRHLRIELQPGGTLQVVDVGSLNGTFVRAANLPARLQKGDELLVGSMLFRLDVRSNEN